jgi:UDP:flavonoid glycosyltransferase YjiC (YdhE family)
MKIGLQAWGSEGDIQPFTALAAGLVEAGHEVTLVVTDNVGRDYSALAKRFGYRLTPVPNPQMPSKEEVEKVWRQIIALGNPIQQAEFVMRYGFDPVMEPMFAAARDLCAESDAVVGHFFVYPLRVAAEKAGVPVATLNIVHNCLPSAKICPPGFLDLGTWSYSLAWRLVRGMVNHIFLPRVNALRTREGLRPDTDVMTQTWAADRLNLIAVSPQICQAPPDWDARHRVCGFLNPPASLMTDDLPMGLDEFLSAGDPPAYFTFGSMMPSSLDYLRETVAIWTEAVRRLGCRAILQIPWSDASVFDSDHRWFKLERAPYHKVFPRCSMVVHHGGAGTTQSALLAGRPSLIVAHVSDQFFWGAELERLGVAGKTLKRKGLNAGKLAVRVAKVLADPTMLSSATALGRRMAGENGVVTAVELIEKHLGDHRNGLALPSQRS